MIEDKIKLYDQIKEFNDDESKRGYTLVDARPPDQFAAGNIKGSINLPVSSLFANQETKELKPLADRKKIFEEAGIDVTKNIAFSCTGGISCTPIYLGAADFATGSLSVYDGSWSEFKSRM